MALDTLQTKQGTLVPLQPFDFGHTLHFIGDFSPALGEQRVDRGLLTKAVSINEKSVVFRVQAGTKDRAILQYDLFSERPLDSEEEAVVVDRIRFYLSLDDDLLPFYSIAENDPSMSRIVAQLHGFHQVKFLTPFENACWAVLTQRMAMPVARSMKQRLIEKYGSSLTVDGMTYWAFPEASVLSRVTQYELAHTIGHEQKGTYLYNVAQAFDSVDEAWLRVGEYDEVAFWLRRIKGFGEWSTSFVLVRGLGRMNVVPADEKHLLAATCKAYGQPLTPSQMAALAAGYREWGGYWALYLRTWA